MLKQGTCAVPCSRGGSVARAVFGRSPTGQRGEKEVRATYGTLKALVIVESGWRSVVVGKCQASVLVNQPIAPEPQVLRLGFELQQSLPISIVCSGKRCHSERVID